MFRRARQKADFGLPKVRDADECASEHGIFSSLKGAVRHPVKNLTGAYYQKLTIGEKASLVAGAMAPPLLVGTTLAAIESANRVNWLLEVSEYLPKDPGLRVAFFASGILEFSFTYGLRKSLPLSRVYDLGMIGLAVAGVSLSFAGITDPHTLAHDIPAGIAFTIGPGSMGAIGGDMMAKDSRLFGSLTVGAALTAAGAMAAGVFDGHLLTGITEFISMASMSGWVFGSSIWGLVKNRVRDVNKPSKR